MKKNKTQGVAMQSGSNSNPECFISSRKNRLPIYKDGKVFLKNGQEFELELFNPTSKPIGAQIKINGQQMSSSMLVIRPGMRYFLDRFLDEARKLVFDTYMAENSAAGKAATALNGLVEVSFHKEKEQLPYVAPINFPTTDWYTIPYYNQPIGQPLLNTPIFNSPTTGGWPTFTLTGGTTTCASTGATSDVNCFYSDSEISASFQTSGIKQQSFDSNSRALLRGTLDSFETGRVEKGGHSSQSFTTYDGEFETIGFHTVKWQIQPESMKAEALRSYCSCGKRHKTTWKFCPACGKAY